MVSIYDKNFKAFPLTGEEIDVLQGKKMKFRNAGHAQDSHIDIFGVVFIVQGLLKPTPFFLRNCP